MKVVILTAEEAPSELQSADATVYKPDSFEGQKYAQLYGAMDWPTVIITRDDGALVEIWQGNWPTLAQIQYHSKASL